MQTKNYDFKEKLKLLSGLKCMQIALLNFRRYQVLNLIGITEIKIILSNLKIILGILDVTFELRKIKKKLVSELSNQK